MSYRMWCGPWFGMMLWDANSFCSGFVFLKEDVDDHEEFDAVDKALSSLDFLSSEKKDMWRLLAAVLHSGEVRCGTRNYSSAPGNVLCNFVPGAEVAFWQFCAPM